jgi:hypothetical protein
MKSRLSANRVLTGLALAFLLALGNPSIGAAMKARTFDGGLAAKMRAAQCATKISARKTHAAKMRVRCGTPAGRARVMEALTDTTVDITTEIADVLFDPCPGGAGVPITVTGHQKTHFHYTFDSAFGIHTFDVTVDVEATGTGVDAFGAPATWRFLHKESTSVNIPGPSDTAESTIDFYFKAVRLGDAFYVPGVSVPDDFLWHEIMHTTAHNGIPTVVVDKGAPKCV